MKRHSRIVHPIAWQACHIKRGATSFSAAETFAAASALDAALFIRSLLSELGIECRMAMTTDSRSFFALAANLKERAEKRLRVDLAAIREEFERGTVSQITWSPGHYLIADALTKDNRDSAQNLMKVIATGMYYPHPSSYPACRQRGRGNVREHTRRSLRVPIQ